MGLEGEPTTLPRPDSRPPGRWSLRWPVLKYRNRQTPQRHHLRRPGRWSPRWPVLPVAGPNSRAAEWGFRPLSDTHWPSHDARRWSVRSDAAAIQAAPMQQLALSFLCSRHCSCRRSLFRLPVGVNVPGLSMFVGRFSGDHHWPVLGDRRGRQEHISADHPARGADLGR